MWLQYYQPLVTDLVQKALVQLCSDNVPYDGKLEIDGIVCISNGQVDKQIVVKVHEVIGNHGNNLEDGPSSRAKGHILQVPGFKRRGENESSTTEQPKKQIKMDNELSPRSIPLNLSQASKEPQQFEAQDNNSASAEKSIMDSPSAGSKDPKRMSISLLKLLSSDQPADTMSLLKTRESEESPQNLPLSPNSSRECSPVSDVILGNTVKCKICSLSLSSISSLVAHTSEVHKRYLCKHCYNSFSLRCNLQRHERLHSGVKPFPCNKCEKSFARNADLKLHMQKHESTGNGEATNTTCQKCSKVFINSQSLRYHLFKVHRVQDGIFACTICEKVFDDEDAYNKHWESHTDSLVQHGQIKVTAKVNKEGALANDQVEDNVPEKKMSPGKSHKTLTYKSLLQPKFKPLVFPKDKEEESNGPNIKDEPQDSMDEGNTANSSSLSESMNIPENDNEGAKPSGSALDFEAIKKEFGPLFHYNDMLSQDAVDSADDGSDDWSLSTSLNIPTFGSKSRDHSPALSDQTNSLTATKNKRKSKPVKHITDSAELIPKASSSAHKTNKTSTPMVVSSSKHLLSGATLIKVPSEPTLPYLKADPSREASPSESLDGLMNISYNNDESPTVTPKAKLKKLPALDREPQGSPSAEMVADDEVTYECRYGGCGQKFFGFKAYEDHFFCAHGRFPCKMCDQSFTCKNNRTRHIRNHLGISKRHPCDRCNKTFTRPDTLQEHKFIHTQSYQADHCNGCGATFDRKALLLAHMKKCFRNKPDLLEKEMLDASTTA